MERAHQHTFQILTKRPERMQKYLAWRWGEGRIPSRHIWHGVSVEHPDYLGRLDDLRATLSAKRFVSFEPLLADLGDVCLNGIDWAIFGGESGPGARPCAISWIRRGVQMARAAECAVFVKQLGALPIVGYYSERWRNYYDEQGWDWPDPIDWDPRDGQPPLDSRVRIRLKDRKGGDMDEWTGPLKSLRIREFLR
jgi:protein gp37